MQPKKPQPPKWAERFLHWFCSDHVLEFLEGDLYELYSDRFKKQGKFRANFFFILGVLSACRPFAIRKSSGSPNSNFITMFRHYFKISYRILLSQKLFSSIKIGGFALGVAACILIVLYMRYEVSYDQHYENGDQIFRVTNQWSEAGGIDRWTNLQGPLKDVFEENIPEMEEVARIVLWSWGDAGANHIRKVDSKNNVYEEGFFYADPELLEILGMPMIYGSREHALSEPNSMVITQSKANSFFPDENPVGRRMILNDEPNTTYTIKGVIADFPATSHLQGNFIMTLSGRKNGPGTSGWCCTNYIFYTKLSPDADKQEVENKMLMLQETYVIDQLQEAGKTGLDQFQEFHSYYLQPVSNIYLNPEQVSDNLHHGSTELIWLFGAIAMIILLLACINFVNLSTAKSIKRAKEVGLRKVVGSFRSSLIHQYLAESVFYSLLAVVAGLLIAWMALPFFSQLAGNPLTIPWLSWWFIPLMVIGALVIGLLSGFYPAIYLSGFKPSQVLRGGINTGARTSMLRSIMVVFQFTATVILIIASLVIHEQFQFIMNKNLGYKKDQVINILGLNSLEEKKREALKNEIVKLSGVENSTLSDFLPVAGSDIHNRTYWLEDRRHLDIGFEAARWTVDDDYIRTMEMEIVQGRNFTSIQTDTAAIIINERMAKEFGLEEVTGKRVIDMFDAKYRIIGIVKDFHFESLLTQVRPLAMVLGTGNNTLSVRINSENMDQTLTSITSVWDSFKPNQTMRYSFMDKRYESMYDFLRKAKTIFILFALISIVIACLGLFALSAYMIEQRSKEVSIRKVLGAGINRIFTLLTVDFVKLILVSIVLAVPIGWYLMTSLLDDFANRIELSWPVFLIAAIGAIVIGIVTISFETIKAALINPAKNLKSE